MISFGGDAVLASEILWRGTIMNKDEMIAEVLDYFEFRNRFQSDEYWGMASSQRPKLFARYFDSLDALAKKELAHTLVTAALGEVPDLRWYMFDTLLLVSDLCIRSGSHYFRSESELLAREFNDPGNVECWTNA